MSFIPRDPELIKIRARDQHPINWFSDFDQLVRQLGRGTIAFVRYSRELWQRRALVPVLAGRELKSNYEMNIVGFGWWLLEPLSLAAVYFVLINVLRGSSANGQVRFLSILIALLPFKWMSSSLIGSMGVVRANASLVTDVYLPRALLPLTQIVVYLAHFCVALLVIPVFMIAFGIGVGWSLIWLPVAIAVQFVFLLGISYIFAVWGLNFRNLPGLMGNLLRLWFYLSPALYTLDSLSPTQQTIMRFNPLTGLFQTYHFALLPSQVPAWHSTPDWTLLYTFVIGLILIVLGGWYFTRREPHFGKLL